MLSTETAGFRRTTTWENQFLAFVFAHRFCRVGRRWLRVFAILGDEPHAPRQMATTRSQVRFVELRMDRRGENRWDSPDWVSRPTLRMQYSRHWVFSEYDGES